LTYASSDYCSREDGHIFLTIKCIEKGGGFSQEGLKYYRGFFAPEHVLKYGDLVIALTDLTRAGDIVGGPLFVPDFGNDEFALPSMDLAVLRPAHRDTNLSFIFYRLMLQDARRYMLAHAGGTTVLHLETRAVPKFRFMAPDPARQAKIAEILSTIDEVIAQTEAHIAKTQQIKAGLMHDLYTRGVTANGQLRPSREEAPQLYKKSPFGWIPKEWEMAVVDDFCTQVVDCPHSTPVYVDRGIPCIRTADMLPGRLLLAQAYRVTEKTYRERVARLVPRMGDIIYSREGERLGIASPVGDEPVCLGQRVMLLRPGQETDPTFMLWGMNTAWFYRRVISGLGATTSPHVNVGDIRKQLLMRPPRDEQERIGLQLTTLQAKMAADETEARQLEALRSGLMSDLLTGRVPVVAALDALVAEVAANV